MARARHPEDKVLTRVMNLLRLAAPSSNSTEHERASAALEAAKVIEENALTVTYDDVEAPRRREKVSRGVWALLPAIYHCSCSHCWKLISRGDIVWTRVVENNEVQFRHNMRPCAPLV